MSDNLDIGDPWGQLAYEDFINFNKIEHLECSRQPKHHSKYVIVCDGISSGHKVYLQKKKHNNYWTQYANNARTFNSFKAAREILKFYHYNNPRIERF